jgi:hypothetical protein
MVDLLNEMKAKAAANAAAKPQTTVNPTSFKTTPSTRTTVPVTSGPAKYFFSEHPDLGFFCKDPKVRVKFDGNFLAVYDPRVADYIIRHYGSKVEEIPKSMYEDGITLKPGAPTPLRSSIEVVNLPGNPAGAPFKNMR